MFDEDEKITLKNTNIRLKAMHKKEVKSVKDLPDDFEYDDPILQETVNITSDYSDMLNKAGAHEVEEKPLLLQYQAEKDNQLKKPGKIPGFFVKARKYHGKEQYL